MKLALSVLIICSIIPSVWALDDDPRISSSHYLSSFFGKSLTILGSEDPRFGGGVSYGYGKPERQFRLGPAPAQLVYEGYVDHTQSPGGSGFPPNATFALGGLAFSRWRWPVDTAGNGVYLDFGWGFQYADRTTLDLSSQLNSTPVAGFGGTFQSGSKEYIIGLRALHMSNAGLKLPNYGQNQLFLMVGVRY